MGKTFMKIKEVTISNHELTEPINLIGLIDSKKGTSEQIIIIRSKSKNVYLQKVKSLKYSKI